MTLVFVVPSRISILMIQKTQVGLIGIFVSLTVERVDKRADQFA